MTKAMGLIALVASLAVVVIVLRGTSEPDLSRIGAEQAVDALTGGPAKHGDNVGIRPSE